MTHSLPLVRPSRACGFAHIPFAGGLLHSRSVGRNGLCCRKSFSPLPKWLKSQAAQVPSDGRGRGCSSVGRKSRVPTVHVAADRNVRAPLSRSVREPFGLCSSRDF